MNRPFLDYYTEKKIIPARQDLGDASTHFARRNNLYCRIGLPARLFHGADVLEIGPGPGDNAIVTSSFAPRRYDLIDGNPSSISELRAKVASGAFDKCIDVNIIEGDITEVEHARQYDIVLAEGMLPGQKSPETLLNKICKYVRPGGVVVTTHMTYSSILPEICRRVVKPFFEREARDESELIERLVSFFKPDLDSLVNMSRHRDDWVWDTIMHPWGDRITFSIAEALVAIQHSFEFHGSQPTFLQDFRWYKSMGKLDSGVNELVVAQHNAIEASLIDYRSDITHLAEEDVDQYGLLIREAYTRHNDVYNGKTDSLSSFIEIISEISDLIQGGYPETSRSLRDYCNGIPKLLDGETNIELGQFVQLFGRGQQYAAFSRRLEEGHL